jgi:hypothetical protein
MKTIILNDLQLMTAVEMTEVNGGADAYDEGYAAGRAWGDGARRALAVVGVFLLFW